MSKKNKIIIIFAVLFAVVMLILGIFLIEQHMRKTDVDSAKEQSLEYLCEKYNANPQEFKLIKYNQAHSEEEEYEIFLTKTVWIDFSFEYEYNNRHFIVSKNKKGYYDDYQFDDIQNWCTEWLQKNVDQKIIGMYLDTENIINYYDKNNLDYKYIISKVDSKQFLKCFENDVARFYFYDKEYTYDDIYIDKLSMKFNSTLKADYIPSFYYVTNTPKKHFACFKFIQWKSYAEPDYNIKGEWYEKE